MMESRYRQGDERMNYFAEDKFMPNLQYAGLFYNYSEEHMDSIANFIHKLRNSRKLADIPKFRQDLENFLAKKQPIEGKARYRTRDVTRWMAPWQIKLYGERGFFYRRSKREVLNICELRVGSPSQVKNRTGLVFLRLKGYEDITSLSEEKKWEVRGELLREWKRLSENVEVKEYLSKVEEIYEILMDSLPDKYHNFPFSKIAYYLFPIEVRVFEGAIIVSKASLYMRRPETRLGLWNDFWKTLYISSEMKYAMNDLELGLQQARKDWDYLRNLLEKSLSQEHLNMLREDWKNFLTKCLNGKSENLESVFVCRRKEEIYASLSYGTYIVPSPKITLSVWIEESSELKPEEVRDILSKKMHELSQRFLGNCEIEINTETYPLEKLFGGKEYFKLLSLQNDRERRRDKEVKTKDSEDLLLSLSFFTTRMVNFLARIRKKQQLEGLLLVLNTDLEEGEEYTYWNYVRFIYSYFGIPVQTITKRLLTQIQSSSSLSHLKNMVISLYKDCKTLKYEFYNLRLPSEATIYAIIERPSPKIFYFKGKENDDEARHYLYDIYEIKIKGKECTVSLVNKIIELQGSGEVELERWIEKNSSKGTKFCLITPLKKSKLYNMYNRFSREEYTGKFLLVRHDELKIAYFSEKSENECFIIYTEEMRRILDMLNIKLDKDVAVVSIKPPPPIALKEEEMHHPALQLFFTEKVGWERDEVYSEHKNLFIFTLLALSMYESDSSLTPFSKITLWKKEINRYLRIRRMQAEYSFPIKPVLYELLKIISDVPGKP